MAKKLFTGTGKGNRNLSAVMAKYALALEDVCLAVLIVSGVPDIDALRVVYKVQADDNKAQSLLNKLFAERPQLNAYIADLRNGRVINACGAQRKRDLRSKSGVLDALEEEANNTADAKQRADIIMKIADLQRMKNDEDKERESLVHYYLPLRCDVCPYKDATTSN